MLNTHIRIITKYRYRTVSNISSSLISVLKTVPDVCMGILCIERKTWFTFLARQSIPLGDWSLMCVFDAFYPNKSLTRCRRWCHYHLDRLWVYATRNLLLANIYGKMSSWSGFWHYIKMVSFHFVCQGALFSDKIRHREEAGRSAQGSPHSWNNHKGCLDCEG